jgi:hypothetical protein
VQPEEWSKIQFGKNTCNTFHSALKNYVSRMITVNTQSYTPTEVSVIRYIPLKILYNVMFNLFIWNILIHICSQSWLMNEVYLHFLMNQSHTIRRADAIIKISTPLLIMILLHPILSITWRYLMHSTVTALLLSSSSLVFMILWLT